MKADRLVDDRQERDSSHYEIQEEFPQVRDFLSEARPSPPAAEGRRNAEGRLQTYTPLSNRKTDRAIRRAW